MDAPVSESRRWRQVKYKEKFTNAFRGIGIAWKVTRHAPVHLGVAILVVTVGFFLNISAVEWAALIFAIGFVVVSEVFNTAIEIDIDLTSPEYHPYARDTKDVAAGAVLVAVFTAVVIGLIIFLPKIF